MDPEQLIVLYSKYSPQCARIVELYQQTLSQSINLDYLRLLCVDNVNLREAILNATNMHIRTVPCVLFIYPRGRVEKFEGPNVSDWIIRQMSKNTPLPHTPMVPLSEQETDILPSSNAPPPRPVHQQQHPQTQQPQQQQTPPESTPLDNLVFDEQDERNIEPSIRPQLTSGKAKTLAEIAADMATSRNQLDQSLDPRRVRNT